MLDDFTPIIHHLPGRDTRVYAVADVHVGAREAAVGEFARWVDRIAAEHASYVVLCGDMVNNGLRDSMTNVYEEVMPPHAQIERAVELLTPIRDKILGAVGGNHEARTKRAADLDPMYAIMLMLGRGELYRPNFAAIRVVLERGKTKNRYALLLVHGKTESRKQKFALATEGFDAIVSGHVHQGSVSRPAKLVLTSGNRVVIKPLVNLTATSWLSYGGYAAAGLYVPAATSSPQALVLEFSGTNDRNGDIRVVW